MATQLQMVNRVLRRLREDEVSTVNETTYSKLIAEFVNDAIEEVATAYDWRRFTETLYADLSGSGTNYSASNIGLASGSGGNAQGSTVFTKRSKLTWINHDEPVVLFNKNAYPGSLTAVNNDWVGLSPMPYEEYFAYALMQELQVDGNGQAEVPTHFALRQSHSDTTGETSTTLYLYPHVQANGTLAIPFWKFPDELALDDSDATIVIGPPNEPVFRYALMLALNERGEEIGEPGNVAEQRYYEALSKAIEDELDFEQRTDRFDWRRD